jgi:hypothetical protein
MDNSTKSNLLFFFLVLFLFSFTPKDKEIHVQSAAPNSFSTSSISFYCLSGSSVLQQQTLNCAENIVLVARRQGNVHVKDKLIKYRKKYKRTSNVCSGIRPPAKDLSPLIFNLFTKESYTTPHFLSHLHHFLFRLTPF